MPFGEWRQAHLGMSSLRVVRDPEGRRRPQERPLEVHREEIPQAFVYSDDDDAGKVHGVLPVKGYLGSDAET